MPYGARTLPKASSFAVIVVATCGAIGGCGGKTTLTRRVATGAEDSSASVPAVADTGVYLRVDSAAYTVRRADSLTTVSIPFALYNRSGATVSENYCIIPGPPELEKQLSSGGWVLAFSWVKAACLTLPPFRVAVGAVYRGTVEIRVPPGPTDGVPAWQKPGAATGTYRLKWALVAGADPAPQHPRAVVAVSEVFRLVEQR